MNKVVLMGRPVRDVESRSTGEGVTVARYTLAVDRKGKDKGADFISCICFGKTAEFAEKYVKKGVKIAVVGRIQTGSYTNKRGDKVYTTDIVVEEHYFCEKSNAPVETPADFETIAPGADEELPFK